MSAKVIKGTVLSQTSLCEGVYSMWLKIGDAATQAKPGQFVSIYSNDKSRMLPRPISICQVNKEEGSLRFVYRVVGAGTEEFSKCQPGDTLKIVGPLGNGFYMKDKKAVLIGGGIGIPPMLQLAAELNCEKTIVVGYSDASTFLVDELSKYGKVVIATVDGSVGTKGNVIDAIKEQGVTGDVIYTCGPTPMLKAVKQYGLENHMECQISLEEKMACGIGACLACVCQSKEVDHHSYVHNKRICKDGPVFYAEEVEL